MDEDLITLIQLYLSSLGAVRAMRQTLWILRQITDHFTLINRENFSYLLLRAEIEKLHREK